MNLERMLHKCQTEQWQIDHLDWSVTPRAMTPEEEVLVVQYFTDMAEIELFAGELFREQLRIVDDPMLKSIFETFIVDEQRHSEVALRLARHYDVRRLKHYQPNPALMEFRPHFLHAVQYLSAEIANSYITGGELILDVALLRALGDFVHDDMSARALVLINRDESRHIAVDFYMTEYYASPAYQRWQAAQPRVPLATRVRALRAFAGVLAHIAPFAGKVMFEPLGVTDPSGKRLYEAVRRIQILTDRPNIAQRPFWRLLKTFRKVSEHKVLGPVFGGLAGRLGGGYPEHLRRTLSTREQQRVCDAMTIEQLAEDALQAKESA